MLFCYFIFNVSLPPLVCRPKDHAYLFSMVLPEPDTVHGNGTIKYLFTSLDGRKVSRDAPDTVLSF